MCCDECIRKFRSDFLLFPKKLFVLLNIFCRTSIRVFVSPISLYVCHVWSVHLIFLSLSCHFWFLSSIILFCMAVVNTFLFNLCREFPVFWSLSLSFFDEIVK